jgi:hypothetical protein
MFLTERTGFPVVFQGLYRLELTEPRAAFPMVLNGLYLVFLGPSFNDHAWIWMNLFQPPSQPETTAMMLSTVGVMSDGDGLS